MKERHETGSENEYPNLDRFSEQERSKIIAAVEEIRNLQETWDVWGHGVSSEKIAESILQEGLFTNWQAVQDIAHRLKEHPTLLADQLTGWSYEGRRYVVLMALKRELTATDLGGLREKSKQDADEHVFESKVPPKELTVPVGAQKHVPPGKIVGYWDRDNFELKMRG